MIQVDNLSRHYGAFKAVDDVSFEIQRGEVVGLLGHNGAGKTTIMKMITGYLEPTAGTVMVDGLSVAGDRCAVQERIGYLPENCPVWPEMTVIDYLEYQAGLHGIPKDRQQAAVARVIGRTALQEKAVAPISTLSRGYHQRVGVAQAILHEPDIIILDEPTNGLDPTQILHMRSLIRELSKNSTVVISTHILQEVQAVCDRVLIMRAGKLVVDSRMDDLQSDRGLLVTLDNGDAQRYLAEIEGVEQVTLQDDDASRYMYSLDADLETAPLVAETVHGAGDKLYGLSPERRDLETLFAQVNSAAAEKAEEVAHA